MSKKLIVPIGCLLGLLGTTSLTTAAVLCVKKDKNGNPSGSIAIRATCKKTETQLDPVTVGLRGPGAVVKDANGETVGLFFEEHGWVLRQVGSSAVRFMANEAGLIKSEVRTLDHESTDCSGPTFTSPDQEEVLALVKRGLVRGTTVHYVSGPSVVATIRSSSEVPATSCGETFIPPNICCHSSGVGAVLRNPMDTLDLSHLVPPFHIEVQE